MYTVELKQILCDLRDVLQLRKADDWDLTQIENMMNTMKKKLKVEKTVDCVKYINPSKVAAVMGDLMLETAPKQEQEKETTMRTEAQEAKDYLIRSLDTETYTKLRSDDLSEAFGMNAVYPKDVKELKEWVAAGKVVVNPNLEDDFAFEWTSPQATLRFIGDKPVDAEGYNKARDAIHKDASDVKDAIIVLGAEKGLEKLNEFKAKTYH